MTPLPAFWSLVRVSLNANFGLSFWRYRLRHDRRGLWQRPLIALAVAGGLAPLVGMFALLLDGLYRLLAPQGLGHLVLTSSVLTGQMLVFLFGLYYLMSSFYYSRDLRTLVPLPLSPGAIMGAKFLTVLANEYLTLAPVLIPGLVIYGTRAGMGPWYWPMALLGFLLTPVVPLALGGGLLLVVMRLTNIPRQREAVRVAFAVIFLAVVLFFQFSFNRTLAGSDPGELASRLLADRQGLLLAAARYFPPAVWLTRMLAGSNPAEVVTGLGYSLLAAAGSVLVLGRLGVRFFYGGLIGGEEVTRRGRVLTAGELERGLATGSVLGALVGREWKSFARHPIFLMNGLLNTFVGPMILVFGLVFGGLRTGGLNQILAILAGLPQAEAIVALGLGGLITFTAGVNQVAATSVSREGRTFWISRIIPVSARVQVLAKLIHASFYSLAAAVLLTAVVLVVVPMGFLPAALGVALGVFGATAAAAVGLLVDIHRPWFDWDDAQKAMKSNINGLFMILGSVLLLLLLGAPAYFLAPALGFLGVLALDAALAAGLAVALVSVLLAQADGAYLRLAP